MNGVFLLIPFFLVCFGLLVLCSRDAVKRAAHFAPMRKEERWAYWLYQLSTASAACFASPEESGSNCREAYLEQVRRYGTWCPAD